MAEMSEAELRDRVRALIAEVDSSDRVAFRGAQFDRGLAWVAFPEGKGGLGLSPKAQTIVNESMSVLQSYADGSTLAFEIRAILATAMG